MFRLACLLLLLLLTYQLVVQAVDAPNNNPHKEVSTNCVDGCSKRTLSNIIWGCLSTTIICAWTAIHPNIPPRDGPVKGILRRLELVFWTIMAPEILPAWALNQLLAAMTIRDMYNKGQDHKQEKRGIWKTLKRWFSFYEMKEVASQAWTLKHGHFLIMGGFHLVEPVEGNSTSEVTIGTQQAASDVVNVQAMSTPSVERAETDAERGRGPSGNKPELEEGRVTVLTLEILQELVKDGTEPRIRITEFEIADRSKGDALSKIIFVLQSSWFICQCIARRVQGLSLTQLELTTLALASLNGITFMLWWDKPLSVQAPVRVYMKRKLTDAERCTEGRGQSARSKSIADILDFFSADDVAADDVAADDVAANDVAATAISKLKEISLWILLLPAIIFDLLIGPIVFFGIVFYATIYDLMGRSTSFPADATHVPTFYVPRHQYSKYLHALLLLALGTTFGGIHCTGWNLPFHTSAEQKLWRVASVAVTIIPIGITFILPIIYLFVAVIVAGIVGVIVFIIVIVIIYFIFCLRGHSDLFSERFSNLISNLNLSNLISSVISRFTNFTTNTLPRLKKEGALLPVEVFLIVLVIAYASARLVLLGLAIALLRHQPPSAFTAIDWMKFYPHVL